MGLVCQVMMPLVTVTTDVVSAFETERARSARLSGDRSRIVAADRAESEATILEGRDRTDQPPLATRGRGRRTARLGYAARRTDRRMHEGSWDAG